MFLTNFQTERLYVECVHKDQYEHIIQPLKGIPYYHFAFARHAMEEADTRHCIHALAYPIGIQGWAGFIKGFYLPSKKIFWIQTFGIRLEWSRQGYGTELLQHLILALTQASHPPSALFISVLNENGPGIHFWEKNGFTPVRTVHKQIYHIQDAITIYQKQLLEKDTFSLS